jgi:dolichyl-phosphate beta-glucosyltransferase
MTPARLAVLVPARNEALRLPAMLDALARALGEAPQFQAVEILIAVNGTDDTTAEVAVEVGARLGLPVRILYCAGRGKAVATVEGAVDLATRHPDLDWLLLVDADGATDPSVLAGVDATPGPRALIGTRIGPGAWIERPEGSAPLRELLSGAARAAVRLLFSLGVRDTQCGFKLLPAGAAHAALTAMVDRSWTYDVELLARLSRSGVRLCELPVRWTDVPGSKVRPGIDALASLAALIGIWIRLIRRG